MSNVEPSSDLEVQDVRYYAVYPDGRRVRVDLEAIEWHGDVWILRDKVKLETEVIKYSVPLYGEVKYL